MTKITIFDEPEHVCGQHQWRSAPLHNFKRAWYVYIKSKMLRKITPMKTHLS